MKNKKIEKRKAQSNTPITDDKKKNKKSIAEQMRDELIKEYKDE